MGGELHLRRPRPRRVEHRRAWPDQTRLRQSPSCRKLARAVWRDGGFLHFGQGKWYPGEQVATRRSRCSWRKDGSQSGITRICSADERKAGRLQQRRFGASSSARWLASSAWTDEFVTEGYEDTWYYRNSASVVCRLTSIRFDARLSDELERPPAQRFDQGSNTSSATYLPLTPAPRWA